MSILLVLFLVNLDLEEVIGLHLVLVQLHLITRAFLPYVLHLLHLDALLLLLGTLRGRGGALGFEGLVSTTVVVVVHRGAALGDAVGLSEFLHVGQEFRALTRAHQDHDHHEEGSEDELPRGLD